jgi:hypothetical protein
MVKLNMTSAISWGRGRGYCDDNTAVFKNMTIWLEGQKVLKFRNYNEPKTISGREGPSSKDSQDVTITTTTTATPGNDKHM